MKTFDDIPEAAAPKAGWREGETVPPPHPAGIERAKIVRRADILSTILSHGDLDERLLLIDHPTRPFLYWMILPKN